MPRSRKALNAKDGWVPFASYFSPLGAENSEDSPSPTGHPRDGTLYLESSLPDMPPIIGSSTVFAHLETLKKFQKRNIPRKTRRSPKNTLVLELEGTSAVSSLTTRWDGASTATTYFQGRWYQIFIFTAAKRDYADKILESLGSQRKLIRHQLYQEDCLCHQGSYIKDLSVLERDLDSIVAVATCREAFPYQPANVILIQQWLGDPQDQELLHLIPVLTKLSQAADVRAEIRKLKAR